MANTSLFSRIKGKLAPATTTTNEAGGAAYQLSPEEALAQLALTGCFNGTFYTSAAEQLDEVLTLSKQVSDEFIAKTAIYARREGFMKDTPALLCALLATRDLDLLETTFWEVIDNGKMLRNFVQIMRSGVTGRKSLGSAPRRLVRQWLNRASDRDLINASIGQSPSLADIVKMVHPKPRNESREAFYAWLIGRDHPTELLPTAIADFEIYKQRGRGALPDVPFQMLTSLQLGKQEWSTIAKRASWQMTRMNLNTFLRHDVFTDPEIVKCVANRLSNPELIRRAKVFPFQILSAFLNADPKLPDLIRESLQDALEISIQNVPSFCGSVVVAPDISGSMHSPVTGHRAGSSSKVRCLDAAALTAAAVLRKNKRAMVLPFACDVVGPEICRLNPRDSVMTNATKLARLPAGGTNCSSVIKHLNRNKLAPDLVIYVSDNESWLDSPHYGHFFGQAPTATLQAWNELKQRNPKAKLVCIDIQPYATTQASTRNDILNIGGFSDQIFKVIARFATEGHQASSLLDEINAINI